MVAARFLADVQFPKPAVTGLTQRGIDIISAQSDASDRLDDASLLRRATALGRVLETQDEDFLRIGPQFRGISEPFCGILFCRQRSFAVGDLVRGIEAIARRISIEDWRDVVATCLTPPKVSDA